MIDHGGGIVTLYAHNSFLVASTGQVVSRGDTVSKAGSTGCQQVLIYILKLEKWSICRSNYMVKGQLNPFFLLFIYNK